MNKEIDKSPKNDFLFKEIFTEEEILKDFLESVLEEKINKIKIEEDIAIRTKLDEKIGILDLKAEINEEKIVTIEMQKEDKKNMEERSLYYGSKVLCKQLKPGVDYREIKPVIIINILDFNIIKLKQYSTRTINVAENHREYEIGNKLKFHYLELPKIRVKDIDINNKLNQWLIFIDNKNKEMIEMIKEKNPIIAKAEAKRKYLTGKAAEERLQELIEKGRRDEVAIMDRGIEIGEERGRKAGEAIGRKEGKREILVAISMLKKKVSKEQIAQHTGLTSEEIERIEEVI